MATVTMVDATHVCVGNVPISTPKVAGYVSGTPDIQWAPLDWARFPRSGKVRIEQAYGRWPPPDPRAYDVLDVEDGAVLPDQVPDQVHKRIGLGITWTNIYAPRSKMAQVQQALSGAESQFGHGWYWGHVDCWLADPDLSEASAAALVGSVQYGMTCRAVQWATPRSNPGTLVPGSTLTLRQANVDLNAAEATWFPAPAPPAPKLQSVTISAAYSDGTSKKWIIS